jgi:hypothetical protein
MIWRTPRFIPPRRAGNQRVETGFAIENDGENFRRTVHFECGGVERMPELTLIHAVNGQI